MPCRLPSSGQFKKAFTLECDGRGVFHAFLKLWSLRTSKHCANKLIVVIFFRENFGAKTLGSSAHKTGSNTYRKVEET